MTVSYRLHRIIYKFLTKRARLQAFGQKCPWTIFPNLTKDSFVVSGGAGDDISFEVELIQKFGCEVWVFDPSEAGKATFEKTTVETKSLRFFLEGLDAKSGSTAIHMPEGDPTTMSWTISGETPRVNIPTRDLRSILRDSGHPRIDLLKIDIEGFEYPVLHAALDYGLLIQQICVEIHQGPQFNHKTRWSRWALICKLLSKGYRLVYQDRWDHTFVHKRFLRGIAF
jgi:FkbM family methyltransferase